MVIIEIIHNLPKFVISAKLDPKTEFVISAKLDPKTDGFQT
jgi:hypothetical protein